MEIFYDTIKIDSKNTKMVAHRGLSGIESENTNAAFVAEGFGTSLTSNDAYVLHGVVIVHPSVAFAFYSQIEATVTRKKGEHMVKKAATGIDFGSAVTV